MTNVLSPYIDEFLRTQNKLVTELQSTYPIQFVPFLEPYLWFSFTRVVNCDVQKEEFLVQSMLFLKKVSGCSKYKVNEDKVPDNTTQEANKILDLFFTKEH